MIELCLLKKKIQLKKLNNNRYQVMQYDKIKFRLFIRTKLTINHFYLKKLGPSLLRPFEYLNITRPNS